MNIVMYFHIYIRIHICMYFLRAIQRAQLEQKKADSESIEIVFAGWLTSLIEACSLPRCICNFDLSKATITLNGGHFPEVT